jgi:hypothetical protein
MSAAKIIKETSGQKKNRQQPYTVVFFDKAEKFFSQKMFGLKYLFTFVSVLNKQI